MAKQASLASTATLHFYRCECGSLCGYGKNPPSPCHACVKCGTTAELNPELRVPAKPHQYKIFKFELETGEIIKFPMCIWCDRIPIKR